MKIKEVDDPAKAQPVDDTLPTAPPMMRPIALARRSLRTRDSQNTRTATMIAAAIVNSGTLNPSPVLRRPKLMPRLQVEH